MDHKSRKNSYQRTKGKSKTIHQYILFAEGRNTEKSYFDLLKKANCKVMPVTRRGHGISQCVDFVDEALNSWKTMPDSEKEKYDKRWLVFDADGRTDFDAAIKKARKLGFHVAFSNMCIEYWFVLHFESHSGKPIPMCGDSHSEAQIRMINKHIDSYNKKAKEPVALYDSGSKAVKEDFFDLMLAINPTTKRSRIVDAFERAKTMHEAKKQKGAEFCESVTTIYELLTALGVINKTKKGYRLYCK